MHPHPPPPLFDRQQQRVTRAHRAFVPHALHARFLRGGEMAFENIPEPYRKNPQSWRLAPFYAQFII